MEHGHFTLLQQNLRTQKKMTMPAFGNSMEPLISSGSLVEFEPINSDLKIFDIIIFWKNENLICHYIRHINSITTIDGERIIITHGLSSGEDLPVTQSLILGRVTNHKITQFMRFKLLFSGWLKRKLRQGFFST